MARVIIGIHGLMNKPARQVEKDWWIDAIREGLETNCGVSSSRYDWPTVFDEAYWADLLYKYPLHCDQQYPFDSLYEGEPYVPANPGVLKKYRETPVDWVRARVQTVAGRLGDLIEVPALDQTADILLAKLLRDLAFYYDAHQQIGARDGSKEQARKVLKDELKNLLLRHAGDEIMVLAHSMGTIIAYDVLRDLGREGSPVRVAHFVTLGSPLGLTLVKRRVAQERDYDRQAPVRTPSIVTKSWINFADRRDPVAVDCHLADDYRPNAAGIQVRDDLVINDYQSPGAFQFHKIFGYLRAPEVSEQLRDFLLAPAGPA